MEVHGVVQVDNSPIESGTITFLPSGNTSGAAASTKITAGRYALTPENGPKPGTYRVVVTSDVAMGDVEDVQTQPEPLPQITSKSQLKTAEPPRRSPTRLANWQQRDVVIRSDADQLNFSF
ncbi:hypothetical protein Pla22_00700 [Rubripirellula amarantea]|uniref:Carboxypeptidase regulatory-like domain-containing protein n=1 Tax=Rubripirellula amarantea TaxID=2527999 RepID=A0A5C5WNP2_9BACT|nr:hypothetical protein [Rubripirellula amarantea]TWT52446.1 hypothetical protein Pla22_00700 [Rubripirellula amarantea]